MDISQNGINLIKKYEGLRLTAYKALPTEKYWTIGYGHYGPDVTQGMKITEAQAEAYLRVDCKSAVNAVNAIGLPFNQNQTDALVSFTYNCGAGNLKSLCKGRTIDQIGEAIILYNKAGGNVLSGLIKRRKEEQAMYKMLSPTVKPTLPTLKPGAAGEYVTLLQQKLNAKGYNIAIDGKFGPKTLEAVRAFQADDHKLLVDGIVGVQTWRALGVS